jgi:tetratricopeptide (TPR) repeat protein
LHFPRFSQDPKAPALKKITTYHFAFIVFALALIAACSQTKNTAVTRGYHNMTSRYNGYFYARESMKSAQDRIEKLYIDDYSQILPVFRLPNTPETKASFADLEKVIKKSSSVIDKHAIVKKGTNPPEEIPGTVKWIDDNWLIMGQAHYYKGEFISAIEIFEYLIEKYGKFPVRFDAIMWKARAEVQMGDYTQAESLLDIIVTDPECPERLKGDIKASYADLYLHTGNYCKGAITNLEEAIPLTKRKHLRSRYTYILGQLYERCGDNKKAFESYGAVVDMHPAYDMLFNAKLSRARLSASDPKNRTASKRELQKMLQDIKNDEFQDQIYYTLAQLEMGGGNKEGAILYYRKSIAASVGNNKQKALSYLALGDIYFTDTEYKNAQAYYDSTMMFLPKDYPDYKNISEKKKSLTTLVRYLNLISTEDSLQHIARTYGGDTAKLYPYIDKLIAKAQEEDRKRKQELEDKMNNPGLPGDPRPGGGNNAQGSFWAYNPSLVAAGVTEFTRNWGTRKLEDNWRRGNKESYNPDTQENPEDKDTNQVAGPVKKSNDKFSRSYYIKNLPLTAKALAASDSSIADAYYNLGMIYKDQMNNSPRSIEAFETLIKRYPENRYALPAHFQLYRLYTAAKNTAKADEQKNFICTKYPTSEYCALLNDPNHEVNVLQTRKEISAYYDTTYAFYVRKDYAAVIARCNYADSTFGTRTDKNEHAAKFAYLHAVSIGKTQGNDQMEKELIRLIANYPKDPVKPQAQALLDALRRLKGTAVIQVPDTAAKATGPAYVFNENVEYQYMVVVETGKGDINGFKIALSDFNTEMFASSGLVITTLVLDPAHQLVLVKKFTGKTKAMDYYTMLKSRPDIFAHLQAGSFQPMVISTENLSLFIKDKKVEPYKSFFEKNILKK